MRKLACVLVALTALQLSGCARIEGFIDGLTWVHQHDDDPACLSDYEADPAVLRRKGIEPDSRRAKAYEAEMSNQLDVDHRSW